MTRCNSTSPYRRCGQIVFEMLLVLPVLVISLFGMVEMAMWMKGRETLEYASRTGALTAARSSLATHPGSAQIAINDAVESYLLTAGLASADLADSNFKIRIEYDVGGGPQALEKGSLDAPIPPLSTAPARHYVRVAVAIRATSLAPNALKTLGFDLANRASYQETTLRYDP